MGGGGSGDLRRVREVNNYKKWEMGWVHVKPSGFAKLGFFPPTEAGRRGPYLQALAGTVTSLGSLEFSQAGTLRGEGGLGSSQGYGLEMLETMLVFDQVFMGQG